MKRSENDGVTPAKGRRLPAGERREQLIEVAMEHFAEHGYTKTTTAKIACAAGVTEPVLYNHFKSKRDLFAEILRRTLQQTAAFFRSTVSDEMNGSEKILALADGFPRYVEEHRALFHLIERAAASPEHELTRNALRRYYAGLVAETATYVEEGKSDGSIARAVDSEALAWMLTMHGVGYCLLSGLGFSYFERPEFATNVRALISGLLGVSSD